MVWCYFHSCAVLNFTDGVSSVNASGELFFVVSKCFRQLSEFFLSLSASHYPELDPHCPRPRDLSGPYIVLPISDL